MWWPWLGRMQLFPSNSKIAILFVMDASGATEMSVNCTAAKNKDGDKITCKCEAGRKKIMSRRDCSLYRSQKPQTRCCVHDK